MKKTFFTAVFALVLGVSAFAQLSKRSMMIGGTGGFENGNGVTTILLSPSVGYFVIDRLAIGGNVGLTYYNSELGDLGTISAGPMARYYFTDGRVAKLFGQGSANFGRNFGNQLKSGFSNFGLGAGAGFFLNRNVSIDAILGFRSVKGESQSSRTNLFGLTFGVQAFLSKDAG